MKSMSIVCDYAFVAPDVLAMRIERSAEVFTTYRDIDADSFRLDIFPFGDAILPEDVLLIADIVKPYRKA